MSNSIRFNSSRTFISLCDRMRSSRALVAGIAALCGLASLTLTATVHAQSGYKRLSGHVPSLLMEANLAGGVAPQEQISLALTLPLRNEAKLDALLARLYDNNDPLYGKYLTPEQFTAQFGPTQADYDAVAAYAQSQGLTVVQRHPNRLVLDVIAPASKVQTAFGVNLKNYKLPSGRLFRAPNGDPILPTGVANKLQGIVGLDTAEVWHAHNHGKAVDPLAFMNRPLNADQSLDPFGGVGFHPNQIGSGPGNALAPSDIKKYYNLTGTTLNGSGQTLALFELDGYTASDITSYESSYGLPAVPLQNVLVDAYSGAAGSGAGEVTLDIELMIALAPGASKILVYEGPNTGAGVVDTYSKIANDNLAKNISTSWGLYEAGAGSFTRSSENNIFKQMAAQGQSIFAAAGDSGAYDNGSSISVDDPAAQPYVTGVGGTTLRGSNGVYGSETTWNGGSPSNGAGGGGISSYWTIPSYQTAVITKSNKGSKNYRNVPDVALDADPNSGYSVFFKGGWWIYGGTSCAAPLWASFTSLVNQSRVNNKKAVIGFLNPVIYPIGTGTTYTTNFHDIADASTNLYYPAATGYDLATGWGSFNGINLLTTLANK